MAASAAYLDDDFKSFVDALLAEHHVPGMSIAVVDGENVEQAGYGLSNLPNTAATPVTFWYTGSTTKAMLAATLGLLMDSSTDNPSEALKTLQRDRWTTRIKDILPEDFIMHSALATENVTIEDALSHRTGMPGCDRLYGEWMGGRPKAITRALRYLGPLNKLFRNDWQYMNVMYAVLGDVIETVCGEEWGEVVKRLLWKPLGMEETFWHIDQVPNTERKRLAAGYFWLEQDEEKNNGKYLEEDYVRFAGTAPAGSTISTVTDYTKWIQALLHAARSEATSENADTAKDKDEAITPSLFQSLTTPRSIDNTQSPTNPHHYLRLYSLGWFHLPSTLGSSHPVLAHAGGLTGFGTQLYLLPNDGFGVVSMGNTAGSSNAAGERACLELMAKKLQIQDRQRKEEFVEGLRITGRAREKAAEAAKAKVETRGNEDEEADVRGMDVSLIESLTGNYIHPGYGTYTVSMLSSADGKDRIFSKSPSKPPSEDTLLIVPVGHRTWKDSSLLHPLSSQPPAAGRNGQHKDERIFFDFQRMQGYGKPGADAPPGGLLSAAVWRREETCKVGACFQPQKSSSGGAHGRWELGLRLANEHFLSDGGTHEGWEEEMAWFTKDSA